MRKRLYVSKKDINKATKKLKRDNDLGMPYHKTGVEDKQREEFLKSLMSNTDFVPTYTANNKKFAEPVREAARKFNAFEYIVIAAFVVCGGGFAYLSGDSVAQKYQIIKQHKDLSLTLFTVIGAILGFGIGFAVSVGLYQEHKDSAVDGLYNRLSVRLFDSMREIHPDLDEKMLKSCNPEMARVIKALLIANMPEKDTREIQSYATRIFTQLRNITPGTKSNVLIECNNDIKNMLSIIEFNLVTNQDLNNAILAVFRGSLPIRFVLKNNQKTK